MKLNEVGAVPIMGWTSQYFGHCVDERFIMKQANALVASGMRDAGYQYVIIHEAWCGGVDAQGLLVADTTKFPDMKRLISELNQMDLMVGLSISVGNASNSILHTQLQENCQLLVNGWGASLISVSGIENEEQAAQIAEAVKLTEKPVLIDVRVNECIGPWIAKYANVWNLYEDLGTDFYEITRHKLDNTIDSGNNMNEPSGSVTRERARISGPGHFYHAGCIPIGTGMNVIQDQAVFSLYCVLGCPIITGIDLTAMKEETRAIFLNKGALSVHQDILGEPGTCVRIYDPWHCLYRKSLSDGSACFLIFNRCHGGIVMTIESDLELNISRDAAFAIQDLWNDNHLGRFKGCYSDFVVTSDLATEQCFRLFRITT